MGSAMFPELAGDDRPLRLGLFGGTFNPIHLGHCQATLEVLQAFALDRIYLIPSALPPHKAESNLATAADRFEMVRLALSTHPRLLASPVELQRPGPSYTVDTLRHFQNRVPAPSRLFFILGMDAFLEIDTWKSYRQLLELADLIVMPRPGAGGSDSSLEVTIESFAQQKISSRYHRSQKTRAIEHPDYHPIHPVRITPVAISSSQLRQMIVDGRDIQPWVPPQVYQYIIDKGLYR